MGFPFIPASQPSLVAFLFIVLGVLAALAAGLFRTYAAIDRSQAWKRTRVIMFWILVWCGAFLATVETGYARENPMPGIPMLFLSAIVVATTFAFSPIGKKLAYGVPIAYLVLFQAFRLPLELVLHEWSATGTIPKTMTWTGQNLDILTGILAVVSFPFAGRYRAIARIFNVLGFGFLLNVMRVAVLSSPGPLAWNIEPKLQLITHVPYALIAPVCIGGALLGHLLLWRSLFIPETVSNPLDSSPRLEHA